MQDERHARFVRNLRYLLAAHNMSQSEFAARICVSSGIASRWLNNGKMPKKSSIDKICALFCISEEELFADYEEPPKPKTIRSVVDEDVQLLVDKFRRLDEHGKRAVRLIADAEYYRCTVKDKTGTLITLNQSGDKTENDITTKRRNIRHVSSKISAGRRYRGGN